MPNLKGKTILLIGAGPTRIGQGGECDQGAVEACEILKEMGCRVITVDANPDAVLTDKGISHQRYVEPLTPANLEQIITIEKPDGVLTLFAGRSGPHLAEQLAAKIPDPTLLWGTRPETLQRVADRDGLKAALAATQLKTPTIFSATDTEAITAKAQELGFPVVLRCDDTELMADGVLVYNQEELSQRAAAVGTESQAVISVEESLWQWRQVEIEILRDSRGQTVTAGLVEYMDCAGIHPGDAIGVTPAQTVPSDLREKLELQARTIADHLEIVGSATIRFAYEPQAFSILVTAVHPRYTRTSAFVSQIGAIPVAGLATLLASGITWKQMPKSLIKSTATQSSPAIVAVKWPVWDFFDQLREIPDRLGPQMQAVGQSLGIGLTFADAMQKAMRGANPGNHGFIRPAGKALLSAEELLQSLSTPTSQRPFRLYEALHQGASVADVAEKANIDQWFISQLEALVSLERQLGRHKGKVPPDDLLREAKIAGFTDHHLAQTLSIERDDITQRRSQIELQPVWLKVPCNNGQEGALHFSTYAGAPPPSKDKTADSNPAVLILGSGPTRIGLGSECGHAVFQAALAARKAGFRPLILDCSLTSITIGRTITGKAEVLVDALNDETVTAIIDRLNPMGIITQFAGNQPIDEFVNLKRLGMLLLGAGPETLALIADRVALWRHIRGLGIPLPAAAVVNDAAEAMQKAVEIGFPVQVRPVVSNATGAPRLIQSKELLNEFLSGIEISREAPLFVERFLEYAIEAQAEVLSDGESAATAAILEQIELAGVHAGDSACVLPPYSIGPRHVETISEYASKVALSLKVKGLLNLRFAVYRDSVFLLEVASRECRNLSVVTKAMGTPLAGLATRIQLGQKINELTPAPSCPAQFSVRAAVFPFNVFAEMDPLLGPRQHSTGEVLAMAESFGMAYFKALEAADTPLPTQGGVLITVTEEDKPSIIEPARIFNELGFQLLATRGTQTFLTENGLPAEMVRKLGFGRPNLVDEMKNGRVQMVINTPTGDQGHKDGGYIRKAAIHRRIANINTPAGAIAAAKGIAARRQGETDVRAMDTA